MPFLIKFMQSNENICDSLSLFYFQWENNEVKCAIIKTQNVNATDDSERTLNFKWPKFAIFFNKKHGSFFFEWL